MPKHKRRSWVIPAIIAAALFVGGIAAEIAPVPDDFATRYRALLWALVGVAGVVAVGAAIYDARRPADHDEAPMHIIASEYDRLRLDYLARIAERSQVLPLSAVDLKSASAETGQRERLRLPDVYVALDTTTPRRDAETKRQEVMLGREAPYSALEVLIKDRRLALVGEPGGGKSTFLNYLAYCLAADALNPRENWIARLESWPDAWAKLLPVPIALRDVAAWFEATQHHQRQAGLFYAFLSDWLTRLGLADFYDSLCAQLHDGAALLMLDGLDEVPVQDDVLSRVKEMIAALPSALPRTPVVVTCRVLSYADPRWRLDDDAWPVYELARLRQEQIDHFIDAWYNQLAAMYVVSAPGPKASMLKYAVRRPDLRRMAPNPLLLTVMALLHTHEGELPHARALLYEKVVDLLLWRWEQTKVTNEERSIALRQLLDMVGQRDIDLKQKLWQLAYDTHVQVREGEAEATADIPKAALLEALRDLHPDHSLDWAEQVVLTMQRRAGLLVERMPDLFTFPHRTFQEYLAGCHLSTQRQFTDCALEVSGQGAFWREVILLAVGRLNHLSGDTDRPLMLVSELCPEDAPIDGDAAAWRNAWLAGDCLLEVGLPTARRRELGPMLVDRVQHRLVTLVTTGQLEPRERAEAGSTLSAIGDSRDLDEMVPVAADPFRMGSTDGDEGADEDEKPQHPVTVNAFRISKYPVTNGQYARFIEATGHHPPPHWNGPTPPDRLRNHPVVAVSWHDARAYCRWLTDVRGEEVRLPTEAEWEKAARGKDSRAWPWGNTPPTADHCNFDMNIRATTPVGSYPLGVSPYGALDMAGNVWEWTSSLYKPYPYDAADGREDPDAEASRTLRGGSFYNGDYGVRCACRFDNLPGSGDNSFGFRVLSPGF